MSRAHKIARAKSRAAGRESRRREAMYQEKNVKQQTAQIARLVRTKPA